MPLRLQAPPGASFWTARFCLVLLVFSACACLARCSLPLERRSLPALSPQKARAAVAQLLGGDAALFALLEETDADSNRPRHAPHGARSPAARRRWMQIYRNILRNEDIDGLLTANVSVRTWGEPLLLGRDVDLLRVVPRGTDSNPEISSVTGGTEMRRMASLFSTSCTPVGAHTGPYSRVDGFPGDPTIRAVDLAGVRQAFSDGFELVVHDMHLRSLAAHDLVDALEAFWAVPVDASLHFFPNRGATPEPQFFAEDMIIVQLDGELDVSVFEHAYAAPMPQHVVESATRDDVWQTRATRKPHSFRLYEGDTLYIPRGCAFRVSTDRKISMHLIIAVKSHECTALDAILAAIDVVEAMDFNLPNPLRDPLIPTSSRRHKGTNADLLRTAIRVAAEFTPRLRNFFPAGKVILSALDDADGIGAERRMAKYVDDFTIAARSALFAPLLDLLVSEDGGFLSSTSPVHNDVVHWARDLNRRSDRTISDRAERMFQCCVQHLRKHTREAVAQASNRLTSHYEARLERSRKERLKVAEFSLAGHGEPVVFVTSKTSTAAPLLEKFSNLNRKCFWTAGGAISKATASAVEAAAYETDRHDLDAEYEDQCRPANLHAFLVE